MVFGDNMFNKLLIVFGLDILCNDCSCLDFCIYYSGFFFCVVWEVVEVL